MIRLNDVIIKQGSFPDKTLLIKIDPKLKEQDCNFIRWDYENDSELFTLICLRRHLGDDTPVYLFLPYVPHARQDRVKNEEDVFTLKYFCEVINSLNFHKIYTLDVHSNVSLALLNNVKQMDIMKYIDKTLDQVDCGRTCIFYPDEGAMKRYSDRIPYPYAFGIKKRVWETGKIQGLDIQNRELVASKDVLIIDDICSKGGTFYHSAKALKEAGAANIYLYVTHLEESVYSGDLWLSMFGNEPLIEKIYTTNPLFRYNPETETTWGTLEEKIVKI